MAALAILPSANVPVHPNVKLVAANSAVLGLPPSVSVTLVSSVFVNAAGVTVGIHVISIAMVEAINTHTPACTCHVLYPVIRSLLYTCSTYTDIAFSGNGLWVNKPEPT